MVLLNRAPYRAALEGYYEFLRSVWVRLQEPAMEAPLKNLPYLYEVWGTLQVLSALVDVAPKLGYVQTQEVRLFARDSDGLYIKLIPDGRAMLVLQHPSRGVQVRFIPQRAYARSGPVSSISFTQVPDVTLEVRPLLGPPELYLFDPKYKLDSDQSESTNSAPKKEDIDKMHAYRDALRGHSNERVVKYAAILYPGSGVSYAPGDGETPEIAAIPANPEQSVAMEATVRHIMEVALA